MEATELIRKCKAGEREALHLLYQQYRTRLLTVCRQYTKDEDTAEDLLHDAFVIILTSLDKLKDSDRLEAWMTSIVHHVAYHYREQLKKEQTTLLQMAHEDKDAEEVIAMPDYDQLQALVTQLPEGYQQVFRLSVFEGLSHQEIGELLDIAPHSSSSQLAHAKQMLRMLIKQSWVLLLLLIAVPTAIWQLFYKQEPEPQPPTANTKVPEPLPQPVVETPHEEAVYAVVRPHQVHRPVSPQMEAIIQPDSIPYYNMETGDRSLESEEPNDSLPEALQPQAIPLPAADEPHYITHAPSKSSGWHIQLAYNGQMGRSDNYLATTTISKGSFDASSSNMIPTGVAFSNWNDYNYYLSNGPLVPHDEETRSLTNIASQNEDINGGVMQTQHEHQLPFSIQLLLSRQLSPHLSIQTGLSYTRLASTTNTGSSLAFIQERQRLYYLGIPLRFGWQWYNRTHLSLYSSAGAMLELPIRGISHVNHIASGISTFQSETSLSAPVQWSTTVGIGLQYNLTPHLGLFIEPSLQYFFDDGSDLNTYRTEHPLSITLPLGLRFHW